MVDPTDLEAAVRAGVVSETVASRLRNFSAERRGVPAADEERFSLAAGLGDVMTAAGLVLLAGTVLALLATATPLAALLPAPFLWALAEHFTRKRRLLLTSVVLFGLFALAAAMSALALALIFVPGPMAPLSNGAITPAALPPLSGLIVAAACTSACFIWWRRFDLPIAYAAGVIAAVNVAMHVCRMVFPAMPTTGVSLFLLIDGLAILAIALWWDLSDIRRETRRADIAFWLHAAAGYQIAGASYRLIFGVAGDPAGWERLYFFATRAPDGGATAAALILFCCFTLIALAIDRRSLLMSSIGFILPALVRMSGAPGPAALPVAAMLLGTMLLCLSAFWTRLRAPLLARLPVAVRAQLPRSRLIDQRPRPVL